MEVLIEEERSALRLLTEDIHTLSQRVSPLRMSSAEVAECKALSDRIGETLGTIIIRNPEADNLLGVDMTLSGHLLVIKVWADNWEHYHNAAADEKKRIADALEIANTNLAFVYRVHGVLQNVRNRLSRILQLDGAAHEEEAIPGMPLEMAKEFLQTLQKLEGVANELSSTPVEVDLAYLEQQRDAVIRAIDQLSDTKEFGPLGRQVGHDVQGGLRMSLNAEFTLALNFQRANMADRKLMKEKLGLGDPGYKFVYARVSARLRTICTILKSLLRVTAPEFLDRLTTESNIQLNVFLKSIKAIADNFREYGTPKITVNSGENDETWICIDQGDVTNFVLNCIENSKVHGGANRVVISAKHEDEKAIISIDDNGIGILEERIPRLEQIFEEGFSTSSTGLGLRNMDERFLAYRAERHGGLENAHHSRGARIEVEVPLGRNISTSKGE